MEMNELFSELINDEILTKREKSVDKSLKYFVKKYSPYWFLYSVRFFIIILFL